MRLFVLAPVDWYERHKRHGDPDQTIEVFSSAFSVVSNEINDFRCANFHDKGLKLEGLSKDQFVSLFHKKEERQEQYAMTNLRDEEFDRLINWIDAAFRIVDQPG
jgi:hypothetical protein